MGYKALGCAIQGFFGGDGKENGNYYRGCIAVIVTLIRAASMSELRYARKENGNYYSGTSTTLVVIDASIRVSGFRASMSFLLLWTYVHRGCRQQRAGATVTPWNKGSRFHAIRP